MKAVDGLYMMVARSLGIKKAEEDENPKMAILDSVGIG